MNWRAFFRRRWISLGKIGPWNLIMLPWVYRTTYKMPVGTTPYWLVFEKYCYLPVELEHKAYLAFWILNFDLKATDEKRLLQLNKLDGLRLEAYKSSRIYKERTKRWHEKHILKKRFDKGDILSFNSMLRLFPGKLRSPGWDHFKESLTHTASAWVL